SLPVGRHDVGNEAGAFFRPTGTQREPDEIIGRVIRAVRLGQCLLEGLEAHDVREPIAADEVAITLPGLPDGKVKVAPAATPIKRAHDQRAVRMMAGLLRRDSALIDEALDERVVPGDLAELTVAEQVG